MVLSITNAADSLNATSRGMLLSMRAHDAQMAQAQSRLATGLRVATPLDGSNAYFTAATVRQRSDALDRLLDGFSSANSGLRASGNASTAIASLLGEMEDLVGKLNALPPPAPPTPATPEADAGAQAILDATGLTLATDLRGIGGAGITDERYIYAFAEGGTPTAHRFGEDGYTVGDLLATINGSGAGVTASLVGGQISLTADVTGDAIGFRTGSARLAFTGLKGSYYEGSFSYGSVDAAEALVDPANLTTTFTATEINYPNGNENDGFYNLGQLLGTDAASLSDPAQASDVMVQDVMVLEGKIQVATAGTHTFSGFINEHTKISIDGTDIVNQAGLGFFNVNVALTAGEHDIRIVYYDESGGQRGIEVESSLTGGMLDTSVLFDTGETPTLATTLAPPPGAGGDTAAEKAALIEDIRGVRDQIDALVRDASFGGTNLASGDRLSTLLNERGTRLEKTFTAIDADSLGLGSLTDADLEDADLMAGLFDAARETVKIHSIEVSSTMEILESRRIFSIATIETLRAGADDLTLADPNAEGAKLLAAQTRRDLASEALAIAATRDRTALNVLEIAMDRGLLGGSR